MLQLAYGNNRRVLATTMVSTPHDFCISLALVFTVTLLLPKPGVMNFFWLVLKSGTPVFGQIVLSGCWSVTRVKGLPSRY